MQDNRICAPAKLDNFDLNTTSECFTDEAKGIHCGHLYLSIKGVVTGFQSKRHKRGKVTTLSGK